MMSLDALNNLNLFIFIGQIGFKMKNNFFFFGYDLDNVLLSLFDKDKTAELDVYNLLLQATNSHHALSATNRKFYWNSRKILNLFYMITQI